MGDVVISSEVRHHDADVTAFGYEIGQMAGQPAAFKADEKLMTVAEQALAQLPNTHAVRGLICTGDAFVCTAERQQFIRQHFPSVVAVEMEASAIAQTCHQFKVPLWWFARFLTLLIKNLHCRLKSSCHWPPKALPLWC